MTTVELAQLLWLLLSATGLALSVSYARIPVLGQGAFMALGAFGTALLGPGGQGWPLGFACGASVLTAAVIGWVVALGASRLEGAALALATWGLAWLVHRVLLAFPDVTGGRDGRTVPSPAHLVSPSLGIEVVLTPAVHVAVAGLLCLLALFTLRRIGQGPAGLDLAALREGPDVAASLGIPVAARRRTILSVTAALGALSGAGSTVLLGLVAPSDVAPVVSLQLFVAVLIGGSARWWGPVVGVAVISLLPPMADVAADLIDVDAERSRGVLTALLLVAVLALRAPVARRWPRRGTPPGSPRGALVPTASSPGAVVLSGQDLTARYDGLLALEGAAVDLSAGEIHAVIGPNGSGKSTLLKVLSGETGSGTVVLDGQVLAGAVAARARAGLVRTSQQSAPLPGLTAERQVAVGARGGGSRSGDVLRHLLRTPQSRRARSSALADFGLPHLEGADPEQITFGDQRLLQVVRAVATGPRVLLLDEPAAGLSEPEIARLIALLRALAAQGLAVLLVEHDVRLVAAVADRVTVLLAGQVLVSGGPAEVLRDDRVREAYLGVPV